MSDRVGPTVIPMALVKADPCPFCAGNDLSIRQDMTADGSFPYAMYVFCHTCHARGRNHYKIGWCETEEAAVEAWNDRKLPKPVLLPDMRDHIAIMIDPAVRIYLADFKISDGPTDNQIMLYSQVKAARDKADAILKAIGV
jgi:Lar family restriction alleviation protein